MVVLHFSIPYQCLSLYGGIIIQLFVCIVCVVLILQLPEDFVISIARIIRKFIYVVFFVLIDFRLPR